MSAEKPRGARRSARALIATTALGAGGLLIASTQPWVSGTSSQVIIGGGALTGTGGKVAPVVSGLALVALAAALATLTAGRVGRLLGGGVLLLAGLGSVVAVVRLIADPAGALQPIAEERAAASGQAFGITAHAGPGAWLALALSLVVCAAGVLALRHARAGSGLTASYERPSAGDREPGTLWEQVSREDDAR